MSNEGPVVSLRDIAKTYRLYQRPAYRVLDLLGLCPTGARYYTERDALRNINLEVAAGEKVAIIGRNGAGKSTLLKIVTGTIAPTAGTARFHGRVSPLLQIGTGFHGDFTGRQNVYAGLAHQGITGAAAHARFDEIVSFAELEEYIDQPMKTYSTGMAARLMFASATAIEPEILVVDELLGVGDAYFAHKSFERLRQMCEEQRTTLLLVTHDIYSALNLCERFIWIDRGEIVMQGDGRSIVSAYEQSIKAQEEQRLRRRNEAAATGTASRAAAPERIHVVVRSRSGFALQAPLALAWIELVGVENERRRLDVVEGAADWLLQPESNLAAVATVAGIASRALTPYGSIFHKAEWSARAPRGGVRSLAAKWHYTGTDDAELVVLDAQQKVLGRATLETGPGWQERSWDARADAAATQVLSTATGHYGSGRLRIREVTFRNGAGESTVAVKHGGALAIDVRFEAMEEPPPRDPTFVVAFNRPGVAAGAYIHVDRLTLPAGRAFLVRAGIEPLLLGSGTWLVTVGLAESDFYSNRFNPYFTVNDRWHHVIARGFEIEVESTNALDAAAFFVQPAAIEVHALDAFPQAVADSE